MNHMSKSNRKIAVVCNYILRPDRVGGMDHFYVAFDKSAKANGIEVDWFFPKTTLFPFYDGLTIHSNSEIVIEDQFLSHLKTHQPKYDVIFTHFIQLCTSFFKQVKQLLPESKLIAVDHNPRPLQGFPLKKRLKNKIKGILYAHYIDTFIAVSPYSETYLKKDFGAFIGSKIQIIYNGIETDKYQFSTEKEANNKFIIACHLRKEKGIQDIINAVALLPEEKRQDMHIDVYGEGPYESVLKEQVLNNGLTQLFHFKGSVEHLYDLYKEYNYLIHASHGETFCYTVVESLIGHTPVITTNEAGNVLKLVKENINGYLFNIGDINGLKNILSQVINSDINQPLFLEYRSQLSEAFSLEKMVNNYKKLVYDS